LQAEAQIHANQEEQRTAALESATKQAEAEAQQRHEKEQQLNAGIEVLRKAEAKQLQRMEEAQQEKQRLESEQRRLQAEEEEQQRAAVEAQQRVQEEAVRRAEENIRVLTHEEEEHIKQLETIRNAAAIAIQQRAETVERLKAEIEELQKTEAKRSKRITEIESRLTNLQAEAQIHANQEEQRTAALESATKQAEAEAQQRHEKEQQLNAQLEALMAQEFEQRERIHQAELAIRARKESNQTTEVEIAHLAAEEEQLLSELELLKLNAETESRSRAEAARLLRSEVESLRKAEAKKLKDIEKLKTKRSSVTEEIGRYEEQEKLLVAELESLRLKVESDEKAWMEKELTIKAEIEAARKAETLQLKRIERLEAKLLGQKEEGAGSSKTSRATSRSRKSGAKPTTNAARRRQAEETWIARLEALRSEMKLDAEKRSKQEQQLHNKLQALCKKELNQLQRVETLKAQVRAREQASEAQQSEESAQLAQPVSKETKQDSEAPSTIETAEAIETDYQTAEAGFETSADEAPATFEGEQFTVTTDVEVVMFADDSLPCTENAEVVNNDERSFEPSVTTESSAAPSQLEETASTFFAQLTDEAESQTTETVNTYDYDYTDSLVPELQEDAFSADLDKAIDVVQSEKGIQSVGGETSSFPALAGRIKSGDAGERAAALHDLAALDESDAFRFITNLFDDEDEEVRNTAARALYDLRPDRADTFTRALREASTDRRRRIAKALDTSGLAAEAINSLAGESREKTYDAFSILFLMAKSGEVQTLLKTIEHHPNMAVQLSVIKLLTFCNQPEIISAFRVLAVRGSLPTEVRSAVMESIYQISSNARENALTVA
jgi:hypothetical protein